MGHRGRRATPRDALSAGDLVLIYLAAPARVFIARAELASSVRPLMPDQPEPAQPSGRSGVLLGETDWWDPPVGMDAVVARIDPANKAKADFDHGVVGITRVEQMTRLGVFTVAHHACSARPSPVTSPPHRGHVSVADRSSETFCVLMGMRS